MAFRATRPSASEPVAMALLQARSPETFLNEDGVALVYGRLPSGVSGAQLASDVFAAIKDHP